MIAAFKRAMRKLTPLEIATRELAEAELSKLAAQTGQEYSSAMVQYHSTRISRLRAFIAAQAKSEAA